MRCGCRSHGRRMTFSSYFGTSSMLTSSRWRRSLTLCIGSGRPGRPAPHGRDEHPRLTDPTDRSVWTTKLSCCSHDGRPSLGRVRVLIVEDEPRMAALLRRGLAEDGYAVDIAGTGTDALWQATEFSYDAVILDVMLPGLDGMEVCRQLRDRGRWMPVLMLTARDAVDDRIRGLDAGADDYLTKPFSFGELAARLRALIRRGTGDRPTTLTVGELRLDPATHRAWRGTCELTLSAKEFALLELFMRHPGQVLSRTRIIEHVWDFSYDGVSNIVDQYVAYLRRKVDRPFGDERLETVRGVGYRMRTPEKVADQVAR